MCTVSFLPNTRGFFVAMNRDEKRTRSIGLPPSIVEFEGHRAIFPSEPNGGTWIAANDTGVCIALINWHRIDREPARSMQSRGQVIRRLIGKTSRKEIAKALAALPLEKLRPFRLIAITPPEKEITEWRWNLQQLSTRKHAWRRQYWFSSGFDEAKAEVERLRVCNAAQDRHSVGSIAQLRRLHRSHAPKRGPFSLCMHRSDAATVSYTEVAVQDRQVTMRYKPGPPCSSANVITRPL